MSFLVLLSLLFLLASLPPSSSSFSLIYHLTPLFVPFCPLLLLPISTCPWTPQYDWTYPASVPLNCPRKQHAEHPTYSSAMAQTCTHTRTHNSFFLYSLSPVFSLPFPHLSLWLSISPSHLCLSSFIILPLFLPHLYLSMNHPNVFTAYLLQLNPFQRNEVLSNFHKFHSWCLNDKMDTFNFPYIM